MRDDRFFFPCFPLRLCVLLRCFFRCLLLRFLRFLTGVDEPDDDEEAEEEEERLEEERDRDVGGDLGTDLDLERDGEPSRDGMRSSSFSFSLAFAGAGAGAAAFNLAGGDGDRFHTFRTGVFLRARNL